MKIYLQIFLFISFFSLPALAAVKCEYLQAKDFNEGDLHPSVIEDNSKSICIATIGCQTGYGLAKMNGACTALKGANGKWKCPEAEVCKGDGAVLLDVRVNFGSTQGREEATGGTK